jgi:hypothetical protein
MGAPYANSQLALDTHLEAFAVAEGKPVRWPNSNFTRPDGEWLWPKLIPADARTETLPDKLAKVEGLYQINVFCPEKDGSANVNSIADQLIDHFAVGTTVTSGGVIVKVHKTDRKDGRPDGEGFYFVPVVIKWRVWATP